MNDEYKLWPGRPLCNTGMKSDATMSIILSKFYKELKLKKEETKEMVEINLGTDFNTAKEESEKARQPIPTGAYDLTVNSAKPGEYSKSKRPMIEFELSIINHSELNGKKIRHTCPLPHDGDSSGIGFLVDFTEGCGMPWEGSSIRTEDYVGRSCRANIVQTSPDDQGRVFSNIKSFSK